jgi:hypothetical protein
MTEDEAMNWDLTQQRAVELELDIRALLEMVPDAMLTTPTRNRLVMAAGYVQDAQDALAAARHRLPT